MTHLLIIVHAILKAKDRCNKCFINQSNPISLSDLLRDTIANISTHLNGLPKLALHGGNQPTTIHDAGPARIQLPLTSDGIKRDASGRSGNNMKRVGRVRPPLAQKLTDDVSAERKAAQIDVWGAACLRDGGGLQSAQQRLEIFGKTSMVQTEGGGNIGGPRARAKVQHGSFEGAVGEGTGDASRHGGVCVALQPVQDDGDGRGGGETDVGVRRAEGGDGAGEGDGVVRGGQRAGVSEVDEDAGVAVVGRERDADVAQRRGRRVEVGYNGLEMGVGGEEGDEGEREEGGEEGGRGGGGG